MDVNYKEVIDYSLLKDLIKEKRTTVKYVAEDVGIDQQRISMIIGGWNQPKTDIVVRIAWALKVPVSKVVELKTDFDEKKVNWFEGKALPYVPAEDSKGELTYEPLRRTMRMYLDYYNSFSDKEKTENDLLDMIEPYRRRNNYPVNFNKEILAKSLVARGYENGYKSERVRTYTAKGIIPEIRTKLRNDRPVSMRTVYDICNFFGCSVDFVMSYK